jgi:uncharacterized membrane protein YozB (DUF420 family)
LDASSLPALNAVLNAVAATLLLRGRALARAGRLEAHRRVMLSAFAVSSVFLVSYLLHKWLRDFENTTFHATGVLKSAYLMLLLSHIVLAMTVPVFAVVLIRLGLGNQRERHRRLARIAWPIWMYVSVTGVVIYVMLYRLNPVAG